MAVPIEEVNDAITFEQSTLRRGEEEPGTYRLRLHKFPKNGDLSVFLFTTTRSFAESADSYH